MAKLNILVVSQYFSPENFRINDLVMGLRDRGHDVTVLAGTPNYPEGKYFTGYGPFHNTRSDFHGARVYRVPVIARGRGSSIQLAANYLSYALSASLLGPLLCREKYDVIFAFQMSPVLIGVPALFLRRLKRIPMMLWVQDLWPDSLVATSAIRSKQIIDFVGHIVRRIYCGSDLILVQSRAFVASINKYGADLTKVRYFPNTAEAFYRELKVGPDEPEEKLLPKGFRIMFAGNIGVAQDFGTILAAAQLLTKYPDIKWIIVGDGGQREWVESKIRELGLNDHVKLIGRHPPEAMPRLFALADGLLVTLKSDPIFELTIPSKLQSYLACGRPVVAALDGEGARAIEEAGAGFVSPTESPESLAQAVLNLYRLSPAIRARMGHSAHEYFLKHFEREKLLDSLIGWMYDLVERRPIRADEPANEVIVQ
ncbi:glycosyltransferase family 4 protein [Bradyrhizobium sp. AZCC 2289]|uniref:glycosyltransferase family 4 protein n=1 Tax=Bradyrhizobium sp. AZCC 2289 TaxID=3117026 RepID=UPI002FF1C2F7